MIQSAVVVPDSPPPSTPSLKRRQSSQSSESSKRPRLDTSRRDSQYSNHDSPPPSATFTSAPPPRKMSSATGVEEKKRGQRLFGALLGTLSQTSAKPAHRRRDEIEKRQQDKLRQKDEEAADQKRKKREEIDRIRRDEQKIWNEQGMQIRHQNLQAMARFLKTKNSPPLYYKPWELRPNEDDQIKRQIEEVEEIIKHELVEHAAKKGAEKGINEVHPPVSEPPPIITEDEEQQQKPDIKMEDESTELVGADTVTNEQDTTPEPTETTETTDTNNAKLEPEPETTSVEADIGIKGKEEEKPHDDHGGEELVEGQEDDVIY